MTLLSILPFNIQKMSKVLVQTLTLTLFVTFLSSASMAVASPEHDHAPEQLDDAKQEDEHGDEHAPVSLIPDNIATQAGIKVSQVSGGSIINRLTVFGKLALAPSGLSHVRARFSGVITQANATVGQTIKAGQVLAEVESNESLKRYAINAPFSGVVIARHANVGELSNGQILFSVANYRNVWAELRLFSEQINLVKVGQNVELLLNGNSINSKIEHIMPAPDDSPYLIARVLIDNSSGQWAPGLFVKANITTSRKDVAVRVPNNAIQTLDGEDVVFVNQDSSYQARAIKVGIKDAQYSEIISGLRSQERFVVGNSYLIKADIEKSGAGHAH
ncbi:efflux RND transporter periplasmic adaptor subunit [Paraglaciecola polaris]|uniref:Fis family transcriptional regulator n=1 Tax=Paraglaciecola polaris LMG 21857 TaxID=1129793 RepID=K6YMN2_9ALTE|nr:HlyD family efflux transporter periplasmic adaptor subunit [Paraglaciecola polaris]GAC33944.1 Fis family transcriptional regulator [Paraglaciecola polaris LMG 21857]